MMFNFRLALKELSERRWFHILSLVQGLADLCNAVNWLERVPSAYKSWLFWSGGKLSSWQIGLFGSISSAISVYKSLKYA